MAEIPKKLVNMNFFLEGRSYSGLVDEVTLPRYSQKKQEYRSAGMLGPLEYKMGLEKMEATIKLPSYEREPFLLQGLSEDTDVGFIFRGAIQSYQGKEAVVAVLRGKINGFDLGSMKVGEDTSLTFTMWCHYFKFTREETLLMEIDLINNVEKFGGVDLQEGIRRILRI